MSKQEEKLMTEYGITSSTKTVYFYKEYRYGRFSDALSYAKSDKKLTEEGIALTTPA
ncbi:MAG: hypothetical protein P8Y20_01670 [Gammaproteobacteria bacterium]